LDFTIICGDWNVVQDFYLDCYNYVRENNLKNREEIEKLKNKLNLVDTWRVNNPESKIYTWSRKSTLQQACPSLRN
jgi:exonuclease III